MSLQLILFDTETNAFRKPADRAELERIIAPLAAQFGFIKTSAQLAQRTASSAFIKAKIAALASDDELVELRRANAQLRASNERLQRKLGGAPAGAKPWAPPKLLEPGPAFPIAASVLAPHLWRPS